MVSTVENPPDTPTDEESTTQTVEQLKRGDHRITILITEATYWIELVETTYASVCLVVRVHTPLLCAIGAVYK